jgi:hypothetical protein
MKSHLIDPAAETVTALMLQQCGLPLADANPTTGVLGTPSQ